MFTRNYYNLLGRIALYDSEGTGYKAGSLELKSMTGNMYNFYPYGDSNNMPGSLMPVRLGTSISDSYGDSYGAYIFFGTGTDPESVNDYTINAISTLSATISTRSVDYIDADRCYLGKQRVVLSNTTGADVTITEYGIANSIRRAPSYSSPFLLYRELLDEPFTIPNGESVYFDFSMKYYMPTELA